MRRRTWCGWATLHDHGRGVGSRGGFCHNGRIYLGMALLLLGPIRPVNADVMVFENLAPNRVTARLTPVAAAPLEVSIEANDVVPVFLDGRAYVSFASQGTSKRYLLNANSSYRFGMLRDGSLELEEIGLNSDHSTADGRSLPGSASTTPPATIAVKILVDEEEPAKQFIWERRLRQRVERASAILDKHCRLRLKVVAVDTWNSDNGTMDFFESLKEFETEVEPFPAQLAIGFTNQYQVPTGRVHLGGTRGPFHSHILLREWSRHVGEPERLELLVHELGHYLGAVHSDAPNSVMRPVLGDRQALRAQFQIRFDPINTLMMAMIVEEVRRRHIREFDELSVGTRRRLTQIHQRLQQKLPEQLTAQRKPNPKPAGQSQVPPLVRATQSVLQEIVRAARENERQASPGNSDNGGDDRLRGDALTQHYVRRAAVAAQEISGKDTLPAFLYALGIAIDDTDSLRNLPRTNPFVSSVENAGQVAVRKAFLGEPTIRGRGDLAKHFFVSAYLTTLQGGESALAAGLAKEMLDARAGGSGFSFADVAANKSGILFAEAVLDGRLPLDEIAREFSVERFMPSVEGLPEGLTMGQVLAQFGALEDGRFQRRLDDIDQLLRQLPAYSATTAATAPSSAE